MDKEDVRIPKYVVKSLAEKLRAFVEDHEKSFVFHPWQVSSTLNKIQKSIHSGLPERAIHHLLDTGTAKEILKFSVQNDKSVKIGKVKEYLYSHLGLNSPRLKSPSENGCQIVYHESQAFEALRRNRIFEIRRLVDAIVQQLEQTSKSNENGHHPHQLRRPLEIPKQQTLAHCTLSSCLFYGNEVRKEKKKKVVKKPPKSQKQNFIKKNIQSATPRIIYKRTVPHNAPSHSILKIYHSPRNGPKYSKPRRMIENATQTTWSLKMPQRESLFEGIAVDASNSEQSMESETDFYCKSDTLNDASMITEEIASEFVQAVTSDVKCEKMPYKRKSSKSSRSKTQERSVSLPEPLTKTSSSKKIARKEIEDESISSLRSIKLEAIEDAKLEATERNAVYSRSAKLERSDITATRSRSARLKPVKHNPTHSRSLFAVGSVAVVGSNVHGLNAVGTNEPHSKSSEKELAENNAKHSKSTRLKAVKPNTTPSRSLYAVGSAAVFGSNVNGLDAVGTDDPHSKYSEKETADNNANHSKSTRLKAVKRKKTHSRSLYAVGTVAVVGNNVTGLEAMETDDPHLRSCEQEATENNDILSKSIELGSAANNDSHSKSISLEAIKKNSLQSKSLELEANENSLKNSKSEKASISVRITSEKAMIGQQHDEQNENQNSEMAAEMKIIKKASLCRCKTSIQGSIGEELEEKDQPLIEQMRVNKSAILPNDVKRNKSNDEKSRIVVSHNSNNSFKNKSINNSGEEMEENGNDGTLEKLSNSDPFKTSSGISFESVMSGDESTYCPKSTSSGTETDAGSDRSSLKENDNVSLEYSSHWTAEYSSTEASESEDEEFKQKFSQYKRSLLEDDEGIAASCEDEISFATEMYPKEIVATAVEEKPNLLKLNFKNSFNVSGSYEDDTSCPMDTETIGYNGTSFEEQFTSTVNSQEKDGNALSYEKEELHAELVNSNENSAESHEDEERTIEMEENETDNLLIEVNELNEEVCEEHSFKQAKEKEVSEASSKEDISCKMEENANDNNTVVDMQENEEESSVCEEDDSSNLVTINQDEAMSSQESPEGVNEEICEENIVSCKEETSCEIDTQKLKWLKEDSVAASEEEMDDAKYEDNAAVTEDDKSCNSGSEVNQDEPKSGEESPSAEIEDAVKGNESNIESNKEVSSNEDNQENESYHDEVAENEISEISDDNSEIFEEDYTTNEFEEETSLKSGEEISRTNKDSEELQEYEPSPNVTCLENENIQASKKGDSILENKLLNEDDNEIDNESITGNDEESIEEKELLEDDVAFPEKDKIPGAEEIPESGDDEGSDDEDTAFLDDRYQAKSQDVTSNGNVSLNDSEKTEASCIEASDKKSDQETENSNKEEISIKEDDEDDKTLTEDDSFKEENAVSSENSALTKVSMKEADNENEADGTSCEEASLKDNIEEEEEDESLQEEIIVSDEKEGEGIEDNSESGLSEETSIKEDDKGDNDTLERCQENEENINKVDIGLIEENVTPCEEVSQKDELENEDASISCETPEDVHVQEEEDIESVEENIFASEVSQTNEEETLEDVQEKEDIESIKENSLTSEVSQTNEDNIDPNEEETIEYVQDTEDIESIKENSLASEVSLTNEDNIDPNEEEIIKDIQEKEDIGSIKENSLASEDSQRNEDNTVPNEAIAEVNECEDDAEVLLDEEKSIEAEETENSLQEKEAEVHAISDNVPSLKEDISLKLNTEIREPENVEEEKAGAKSYLNAFEGKDSKLFESLDLMDENLLEIVDEDGWNMLHLAASKGLDEFVENLLRHGLPIDSITGNGYTPLQLAVMNNHLKCCQILLKNGATFTTEDGVFDESFLQDAGDISAPIKELLETYKNNYLKVQTLAEILNKFRREKKDISGSFSKGILQVLADVSIDIEEEDQTVDEPCVEL